MKSIISILYIIGLFLINVGFLNILSPSYLIENNKIIFIIYRWEASVIFVVGVIILIYATILWQKYYKSQKKKS
jgi:membrane protein implicated in regulation of membrane protease activity